MSLLFSSALSSGKEAHEIQTGGSNSSIHFAIPLKPHDKPVQLPTDFQQVVKNEYATKYLERIGASATQENIKIVLDQMPIDTCDVTAAWKSRGWLADFLYVTPPSVRRDLAGKSVFQSMLRSSTIQNRMLNANINAKSGTKGVANASTNIKDSTQINAKPSKTPFEAYKRKFLFPYNVSPIQTKERNDTQATQKLVQDQKKTQRRVRKLQYAKVSSLGGS